MQLAATYTEIISKFFKFAIVGSSGIVVDFLITWLCKEKLRLHKYISNSLGFCTSAVSNYFFNRYWTFYVDGKGAGFMEFSKFFGIAVAGLLLNTLIVFLFHEKLKINFYFSKVVAIGIISVWNFVGNYFYTF